MLSSQILLTEEFVEKMLEDLEDLTSPEEVRLLDFSLTAGPVSHSMCLQACALAYVCLHSVGWSLRYRDRQGEEPLGMLNNFISLLFPQNITIPCLTSVLVRTPS
jgi:hypothetical protein